MRPLPSLLLLCASYGVTAIVYDFSTGKNGLDYCIAEADTTSDMTASTTMAPPPWTSLAPSMSATTWAPGVCEHNPMRDEGSEQCIRPASLSPSESAICFDDPFFDLFLAICRLQTRQRPLLCRGHRHRPNLALSWWHCWLDMLRVTPCARNAQLRRRALLDPDNAQSVWIST